ncbi:MAG TPA: redoxin domain-containing protein [Acidobacteriota bacterium]|jgi:peroxiredoxin|nr:redoxin domain-containing protein [Acidobacteriota bacterium]
MNKKTLTTIAAALILLAAVACSRQPSPAQIQQEYTNLEAAMKADFTAWQKSGGEPADPRLTWRKRWQEFVEKYPNAEQASKAHFWILSLMRSMQDMKGVADYLQIAARYPNNSAVPAIINASVPQHLQLYGIESASQQLKKITATSKVRENQAAASLTIAFLQPDDPKRVEALQLFLDTYGNTSQSEEARRALDEFKQVGIGAQAPAFEFNDLNGKQISLSDLKGRWVLLDFWATWCGPCAAELPELKAIHAQFKDNQKFAMIGISLDQDKKELLERLKKDKIGWSQYFDGKGWENRITRLYRVTSIPDSFLIDPDGKIQYKEMPGAEVRKILAEKLR